MKKGFYGCNKASMLSTYNKLNQLMEAYNYNKPEDMQSFCQRHYHDLLCLICGNGKETRIRNLNNFINNPYGNESNVAR